MCLIAFAIGASPRWPLVVAANRDEFLNRPTAPLARW
ncbi:MAG: NRDE family protein, partial [Polaromonas sp.]|nr:NRDE family protein [Polaromonas sp.]